MDPNSPEFTSAGIQSEPGLASRLRGAKLRNISFITGYERGQDVNNEPKGSTEMGDDLDRSFFSIEEQIKRAKASALQRRGTEIGFSLTAEADLPKPTAEEPIGGITVGATETFPQADDPFFEKYPDRGELVKDTAQRLGAVVTSRMVGGGDAFRGKRPTALSMLSSKELNTRRREFATTTTTESETDREGTPRDVASAVLTAIQSPYFVDPLIQGVEYESSRKAQLHRRRRFNDFILRGEIPRLNTQDQDGQIQFENIRKNNMKLAPDGELHRDLAIPLALSYRDPQQREKLMEAFDDAARRNTRELLQRVKAGEELDYDIFIKGGGEYAAAAAQHIRELAPELKIFVADKADHMGGQFASYGPRPSFRMNSRVRVGGRYEPYVPRTSGDINSQGPYAILSLSDLQDDIYADNTVRGDMTKMAVTIAANDVAIHTEVGEQVKQRDGRFSVPMQTRFEGEELEYNVNASVVIDARGIRQKSALSNVQGLDEAIADGNYYTTAGIYRLFGGRHTAPGKVHDPMAALDGKIVEVDAFADGGKTVAELLVRALPSVTYGPRRREGPRGIKLTNAPGLTRDEIVATLRSRYSGSFPQFLPKSESDPGGLIDPYLRKVASQVYREGKWTTRLFGGIELYTDVKIDTTSEAIKLDPDDTPGVLSLGPAFYRKVPSEVSELLDALRVGDNTDALWFNIPGALIDSEVGIEIARAARRR